MMLPRLNKQWLVFYETYNYQTFFQMKEYLFAKELLAEFSITNKSAQLYVCGWLLGMALGDTTYPSADFSIIHELVERIIKRFELLSGIRFKDQQRSSINCIVTFDQPIIACFSIADHQSLT